MIPCRPNARRGRPAAARPIAALAGLLLLLAAVPAAPVGATPAVGTDMAAMDGLRPSIQYEQAIEHADDATTFTAGGRVTVPFTPRTADRWTIDGGHAVPLPAGRLTGKSIREARPTLDAPSVRDSITPPARPIGPVDAPFVDPAAATSTHLAAVVDPGGLRREVFGFLPYWEIADSSTRLDWEKLSTIAYFGVGAAANGDLQRTNDDGSTTVGWSGWTSSNLTGVIDQAHANGARVVLTVQSFAWTSSQLGIQKSLLGSATARDNLARQIAAAVRDRGADGVNLDFEPIAATYADEFTALVQSIRAQLDAVAPGYQLTFDTMGWIGNYPIEAATGPGGADAVVVMGYDYRNGSAGNAGSVSPIGGPTYDLNDTLAAYVARIPASRIILGVPYYGRAWSTSSPALNATTVSAAKYGASVAVLYGDALEFSAQYGRLYDPVEGVAWTTYPKQNCTTTYGCVTATRELYYDDAQTLAAKYDLVNSYGIRGVGIWALGYDGSRPELYQVLKDKFITDTIPPAITASTVSPTVFSPNGDGRQDSTTMSVSVTGLIRYGWVVEPFVDGTAGPPVVQGSADGESVAWTWDGRAPDGTLAPDGTYRITVWAADASDNRSSVQQLVTIDNTAPVLTATAGPASISPNGDRRFDVTTLGLDEQRAGQRSGAGHGFERRRHPHLEVLGDDHGQLDLGRQGCDGQDGPRRHLHVPPRRRRPGRQRHRPAVARPGRPDHRLDHLGERVVQAEDRPDRPPGLPPDPAGHGRGLHLPGQDARPADLGRQGRGGRLVQLVVERPERPPRAGPARRLHGIDHHHQRDRRLAPDENGHRQGAVTGGAVTGGAVNGRAVAGGAWAEAPQHPAPRTLAAMTDPTAFPGTQASAPGDLGSATPGAGVWVIVPTYNEADNLRPITSAILAALPAATVLVVDDDSPDGTGRLADDLAGGDPRIRVLHRAAKQGLGRAYLDGFAVALADGASTVVQMDADFSHDPSALPGIVAPVVNGAVDLVIGSRYTRGGGVVDWGVGRRVISRGGSLFARTVLGLGPRDLTGGFKAWRAETLAAVPFAGVHAGGYVFQIEMTFRASRAGARIRELPITFRDRRVGQSKMSRRIVAEALVVVVQLRAEELRDRLLRRPRRS